jgi:hypothetical protein
LENIECHERIARFHILSIYMLGTLEERHFLKQEAEQLNKSEPSEGQFLLRIKPTVDARFLNLWQHSSRSSSCTRINGWTGTIRKMNPNSGRTNFCPICTIKRSLDPSSPFQRTSSITRSFRSYLISELLLSAISTPKKSEARATPRSV